jgi:hypothetical protein
MRPNYTMNIIAQRSYTSKQGNKVFVYAVSGTKEQLEKFKTASGEFYREAEDGTPLWFTTRSVGNRGELIITTNGKIVPDMSKFDQAASLAKQYGGNLGEELAKHAAAALLGKPTEQAPQAQPEAKSDDLGAI